MAHSGDAGLILEHPADAGNGQVYAVRLCVTEQHRRQAYELRYRAYRSIEAIDEGPVEQFSDPFDGRLSRVHLLELSGRPIGSIRCSIHHPNDGITYPNLQTAQAYSKEIQAHCGTKVTIVESSRFVIDPDHDSNGLLVQSLLFRMICLNAVSQSARFLVTAVRPKHVSFYKRAMNLHPISASKAYPGLHAEMVLLCGDFAAHGADIARKAPMFFPLPVEIERYEKCLSKLGS
jgi:hypothetical protein